MPIAMLSVEKTAVMSLIGHGGLVRDDIGQ